MQGLGISEGIAIGIARIMDQGDPDMAFWGIRSPEENMQAFNACRQNLIAQLVARTDRAVKKGNVEQSHVFEAHQMMLSDPEVDDGIKGALQAGTQLPEAIDTVFMGFVAIMESLDDAYLKERGQDYRDLRRQLLKTLDGTKNAIGSMDEAVEANEEKAANHGGDNGESVSDQWIAVASDFTPSDITLADEEGMVGFLCEGGAATTHFSILAKIAGLPTVLQVQNALGSISEGDLLIMDGKKGTVMINPDSATMTEYRSKMEADKLEKTRLMAYKDLPTVTTDGHTVHLEGNIAGPQDVERVLENGAEGVGLFRTEFIYMDREQPPTESEQTTIYGKVLSGMKGKPVVIRTLDVGGDKELPYLNIPKEENPFLGMRAVRYCLQNTEIFKTQLRALLRASIHGHLEIMVPMISCVEEMRKSRELFDICKQELTSEGVSFDENVAFGMMMEVPSAAIVADLLAQEAAFFSIGTNDLVQYVMATDRMNADLKYLYTPHHPAVIRVLKQIIDGAHAYGIPAAMCGELAGDVTFTPVLIGLGLDRFSMNPGSILKVRERIRSLDARACKTLVERVMAARTVDEVREHIASANM